MRAISIIIGVILGVSLCATSGAQSLNNAPTLQGSGCATVSQQWVRLSASRDLPVLVHFRDGVPATCAEYRIKAAERINMLVRQNEAAAAAESKRVLEAEKKARAGRRAILEIVRNSRWYLQPMNTTWTCSQLLAAGRYHTYGGNDDTLVTTSHSTIDGQPRFAGPFRNKIVSFEGTVFVTDDGSRRTSHQLLSTSRLMEKWDSSVAYYQAC